MSNRRRNVTGLYRWFKWRLVVIRTNPHLFHIPQPQHSSLFIAIKPEFSIREAEGMMEIKLILGSKLFLFSNVIKVDTVSKCLSAEFSSITQTWDTTNKIYIFDLLLLLLAFRIRIWQTEYELYQRKKMKIQIHFFTFTTISGFTIFTLQPWHWHI